LLRVCSLLCLEAFLTVSTWEQELRLRVVGIVEPPSYGPVRRSVRLALRTGVLAVAH